MEPALHALGVAKPAENTCRCLIPRNLHSPPPNAYAPQQQAQLIKGYFWSPDKSRWLDPGTQSWKPCYEFNAEFAGTTTGGAGSRFRRAAPAIGFSFPFLDQT